MANEPLITFAPQSVSRISDTVRAVEQTPVMRQLMRPQFRRPQARTIRWARTTTNEDYPSYPDTGPCYVVEFGDCVPSSTPAPGSTVSQSFTAYDPAWTEVAVDPDNGTWDQGTVVRVELNDDGTWWIRPAAPTNTSTIPWFGMELASSYSTGSGSILTPTNDRYCSVYSSWGDDAGTNVTVNNSMSGTSSTMFTITAAGWYIFVMYFKAEMSSLSVTQAYEQFTTSAPSSGASHTHTVDVDLPWFAAPWMIVERQRSAGGSWDNGIISPMTSHYARTALGQYIPYHEYGTGGTTGPGIASATCLDHTVLAGDKFRVRLSGLFDYLPSGGGNLGLTPAQAVLWVGRLGDAP